MNFKIHLAFSQGRREEFTQEFTQEFTKEFTPIWESSWAAPLQQWQHGSPRLQASNLASLGRRLRAFGQDGVRRATKTASPGWHR